MKIVNRTTISPLPTPTVSKDYLTLTGADESFSSESNFEVLRENLLSILLSPSIVVFFSSYPTVTGIPYTSKESFIKSHRGERFSLAYSLAARLSITSYKSFSPLLPRPSFATTLISNRIRSEFKCYAMQCGVQVEIRSEKGNWSHVIGNAIEKLKSETPNFSSVFVDDSNIIQIIRNADVQFSVFIPYKKAYFEKLEPQFA